jgi:hypothetical protein
VTKGCLTEDPPTISLPGISRDPIHPHKVHMKGCIDVNEEGVSLLIRTNHIEITI